MNKWQRHEYILSKAEEMARSGRYADWYAIEIALRHAGLPEARQLLDSNFTREELNQMCNAAAQKGME